MTREQLRQELLDGADELRNHSIIWNRLSAQQKQLATAARAFWATDSAVTNAALDAILALLSGG